jgi:hypothetical protein
VSRVNGALANHQNLETRHRSDTSANGLTALCFAKRNAGTAALCSQVPQFRFQPASVIQSAAAVQPAASPALSLRLNITEACLSQKAADMRIAHEAEAIGQSVLY